MKFVDDASIAVMTGVRSRHFQAAHEAAEIESARYFVASMSQRFGVQLTDEETALVDRLGDVTHPALMSRALRAASLAILSAARRLRSDGIISAWLRRVARTLLRASQWFASSDPVLRQQPPHHDPPPTILAIRFAIRRQGPPARSFGSFSAERAAVAA